MADLFKDKTAKQYTKLLRKARKSGDRYVVLKRNVPYKDLQTLKTKKIIVCIQGSEDFDVYNKNHFLMGNASKIYTCKDQKNAQWEELCSYEIQGVQNIKRIKINSQKSRIAFVCDEVNTKTHEK